MNDPSQMMSRGFGMWPPPQPAVAGDDSMVFRPAFAAGAGGKPGGRINWKGKKAADKRKKAAAAAAAAAGAGGGVLVPGGGGLAATGGSGGVAGVGGASGYKPPTLKELQFQNRVRARRFYPKKKPATARFAPFAPRNTTSFIIRAKRAGGIASLVSPCPVTPAILPTPKFSPTREGLVDMAKEEWGVDGYGSMKGLIRLRSPGGEYEICDEAAEDGDDSDTSESDLEEHVEVERRLDHDLSRFEMVYPGGDGEEPGLGEGVPDARVAHLEEENLTLKERLFLMEREMVELRQRLQVLETRCGERDGASNPNANNNNNEGNIGTGSNDNANEEASENDGGGDVCSEKSVGDGDEGGGGTPVRE